MIVRAAALRGTRETGTHWGNIRSILGLYMENGKEMETTLMDHIRFKV